MDAASAEVGSAPRITRHLAFVIPAAAERRILPESAGRGAFGNTVGEPATEHAARYYKLESTSLQRGVERTIGSVVERIAERPLFARRKGAAQMLGIGRAAARLNRRRIENREWAEICFGHRKSLHQSPCSGYEP